MPYPRPLFVILSRAKDPEECSHGMGSSLLLVTSENKVFIRAHPCNPWLTPEGLADHEGRFSPEHAEPRQEVGLSAASAVSCKMIGMNSPNKKARR